MNKATSILACVACRTSLRSAWSRATFPSPLGSTVNSRMWVGYASTQRAYTSGSSSPKSPTLPQSAFEKPGPLPLGNKQQQLEYEALLKEAELRSQADSLDSDKRHPDAEKQPLPRFPNNRNPSTGEIGGPRGVEPTRYGDWERKGRTYDF